MILSFTFPVNIWQSVFKIESFITFNRIWAWCSGSDFPGNVRVVLHNLSNKQVEHETDNRIAQVVFQKVKSPVLLEVSDFNNFT